MVARRNDNKSPSAQSGPGPLRPGSSINADALWLFGFDTVRVDPETLHGARRLGQPAFGESTGAGSHVFFYDPGSGQVGRLDAATSRFTKAQPAAAWVAPGGGGHIAARGNTTWIVTGLATVERIDGADLGRGGCRPDRRTRRNRYVGRRRRGPRARGQPDRHDRGPDPDRSGRNRRARDTRRGGGRTGRSRAWPAP